MRITQWLAKKIGNYLIKDIDADNRAYLCDFDRICHEIIPGDVLLVEGANRISRIIKRVTHSPWTHAALYIGRVHSIENPELNIQAGVAYIKYLTKFWEDIPEAERLNFVLASYNAGPGHISDARRLAIKYGKNPNVWNDNVDEFIIKKSSPEYYNDDVVRYGYCRGQEPYDYVSEITDRFNYYSQFIKI